MIDVLFAAIAIGLGVLAVFATVAAIADAIGSLLPGERSPLGNLVLLVIILYVLQRYRRLRCP